MPNGRRHVRTGRPPGARPGNTQTVKHGLRRAAFLDHRRMVVATIREAREAIRELRRRPANACATATSALHLRAMLRAETCQPIRCQKCSAPIQCGDDCRDLNSGRRHPRRRWSCGQGECASGFGRPLTYYCSTACRWRHRRARLHVSPKPRKCAACRQTFTPQRSDAKTCGGPCRQALYRRRLAA
jgi:hypothetical protein